ncbi:ELM1/GtrOC1 family putative glycosyltransferase [Aestuariivirga sp.]|uniref:ELM1/GtrOC1 family putative glycosyltransferase n=1 Tax=Aestuariivirga sp. TaxID=2650926 RepID=UPI0039E24F22
MLHGPRTGDNAQTRHLADALGLPYEIKQLGYNALHHLPSALRGASLASLDDASRALIVPPWPRLVIAVGKRSVPVARFIKKASGGAAKLVHIGRPRAPLDLFDLVVTTPQYQLPRAPNVVELALPFSAMSPVSDAERERWSAEWKDLPRPLFAVSLGAGRFPQRLGAMEVLELSEQLKMLARTGHILLLASPRTKPEVLKNLAERLGPGASAYPFNRQDNPYRAALDLADRVVVTSDSMSMLGEAIASGKPVSIFELPESRAALSWSATHGPMAFVARKGLLTPPRSMGAVARRLIAEGVADRLGEETHRRVPFSVDYESVLARIRALVG